jgi:hypothetical protein
MSDVATCTLKICPILSQVGLIGRAPAGFFEVVENPSETLPGLDFVGGRDEATNQPLESATPMVLEQVCCFFCMIGLDVCSFYTLILFSFATAPNRWTL